MHPPFYFYELLETDKKKNKCIMFYANSLNKFERSLGYFVYSFLLSPVLSPICCILISSDITINSQKVSNLRKKTTNRISSKDIHQDEIIVAGRGLTTAMNSISLAPE